MALEGVLVDFSTTRVEGEECILETLCALESYARQFTLPLAAVIYFLNHDFTTNEGEKQLYPHLIGSPDYF